MAANKKVTIETLAIIMQNGLNEVHVKMDKGFAEVSQRLDKIEETKADKADIDRVLTRIGGIGSKVNDYRADQLSIKIQVDRHEVRVAKLEKKTG